MRFSCDRDSDFHARDIAMENQVNVITHIKITSKFNLLSAQASRKTLQATVVSGANLKLNLLQGSESGCRQLQAESESEPP